MLANTPPRQAGFTIVELMIATAVFSVVLLIVTAGVISFSRQYYRGIVANTTQNVTRSAVTEISQALQFSSSSFEQLTPNGSTQGYCVNGKPYYYAPGYQISGSGQTPTQHGLVALDAACPSLDQKVPDITAISGMTGALTGGRELLGDHMRVANFQIESINNVTQVTLRIVYGDDDLLCSSAISSGGGSCQSGSDPLSKAQLTDETIGQGLRCLGGSQFCSYYELSTNVVNRIMTQ